MNLDGFEVRKRDLNLYFAVLIGALGYLVDIYDMMIFSVVRVSSLREIGVSQDQWTSIGLQILNWQLIGMLIGGLLWGVLGDKKGRVAVLFGSIFLYSSATLANIFVASPTQYTILRFIAGIGLAGELGASVTLVSELLPVRNRGYGTMAIAGIGVFGAILAGLIGQAFHWKTCFFIGGILGFALLFIRISVMESGLFKGLLSKPVSRGSLSQLFGNPSLLARYFGCLFLAIPAWMLIGLFTTLAPEIGKEMGFSEPFTAGQAIFYLNIGICFGDFSSSLLSQLFQSRKKTIGLYLVTLAALAAVFGYGTFISTQQMFWLYLALGVCAGYWAVFMMTTAEQFGTNLRATVATSTPNLVRAAIVPITMILQQIRPSLGLRASLTLIILLMITCALFFLLRMKETFGESLDFLESAAEY